MFGLSFLSPWFLLGALAAAAPVFLHLFAREHAPLTILPTARLVPAAEVQQTRRRRLQDPLLLLLRVLTLCLLAFVFARPFLAHPSAIGTQRNVIVAIDRSFSMSGQAREQEVARLVRAAVESAPAGSRVGIVSFDQDARVEVKPTATRFDLGSVLERARPGDGSTNYAAALRAALELTGPDPARIVMVTDAQRSGLDAEALPPLPSTVVFELRPVAGAKDNVSVDAIDRTDDGASALVRNHGSAGRRVQLRWLVDGKEITSAFVDVPPNGATEARLERSLREHAVVAASVVDATGFAADNTRFLVTDPLAAVPVLVVAGVDGPREASFYVTTALEAADPGTGGFGVRTLSANDPALSQPATFSAVRTVVLVGTRGLDRRARTTMAGALQNGLGMLIAAGPEVEPGVVRELLGEAGRDIADGVATDTTGQVLAATDVRHPVMAVLERSAGNLGQVRVERAWTVREPPGSTVLLRLSSGRPALCEFPVARGRVFLFTSDLGRRWNTWPLHPTFVPFVLQTVRQLSGSSPRPREVLVGDLGTADALHPGVVTGRGDMGRVAVNVDPRESRIETVSLADFNAHVEHLPTPTRTERTATLERGRPLWRYGVWALFALLAVETLVAARARGRAATRPPSRGVADRSLTVGGGA